MPSILNLKFKGNKSFVAFSNLSDTESLTKTWKVCTKVASYLEQGQRLENLSWRLWHLQNLMVDSDNAKSKREFRKLSKCMGDKLDKEKGRNITELEAPDFKRNHSTDIIQQRAAEKERLREASQNAKPGTIKRMQFTFSIDQPPPSLNPLPVNKPDLKPSPEFNKRARRDDRMVVDDHTVEPLTQRGRKIPKSSNTSDSHSLRFPTLFSNDFGPSALLYPAPTLRNPISYGEGLNPTTANDGFSIVRPTIELALDELLDTPDASPADVAMQVLTHTTNNASSSNDSSSNDSDDEASDMDLMSTTTLSSVPPISQTSADKQQSLKIAQVKTPSSPSDTARASTPTGRPSLTVRTQPLTRSTASSAPGATPTSLNPALLNRSATTVTPTANVGNGPGGAKAECSNCGATHTPLWRRGLNDELNCNACGLYCKLHKRPRPKSMRNSHHNEGRSANTPSRQDSLDVTAQCYNCQTTTTPLWRKDDDGKTVCNACGLYYKLHGSARPISMKSDIIRKRSRHEARRAAAAAAAAAANHRADTPSASPDVSRRTSPSPLPFPMPDSEAETSPTFAPDSSTAQIDYDFRTNNAGDEDMHLPYSTQSELLGALGPNQFGGVYAFQFPGPYAAEHLQQFISNSTDPLPFASVDLHQDSSDSGLTSPRSNKRRRMSNDSTSEPPSSAVSFSSYGDGYSSSTSATSHSQRSSISMEFPFSCYPTVPFFNGSSTNPNTPGTAVPVFRSRAGAAESAFWHPPMMLNLPQNGDHHPPMLPPEESPMDYLQPPPTSIFTGSGATTTQEDEQLFSTYLHPPMCAPDDGKGLSSSPNQDTKDENAMEGITSTNNSFDRFWA